MFIPVFRVISSVRWKKRKFLCWRFNSDRTEICSIFNTNEFNALRFKTEGEKSCCFILKKFCIRTWHDISLVTNNELDSYPNCIIIEQRNSDEFDTRRSTEIYSHVPIYVSRRYIKFRSRLKIYTRLTVKRNSREP